MKVRRGRGPARAGDASILSVQRCSVEGPRERSPLVGADGRTIEPIDSIQRPARHAERPLSLGAVGDRERRHLTRSIVPRHDGVAGTLPAIVPLRIGHGPTGTHVGPPGGGVDRHGIQLDQVACRTGAATRNSEHDRGMAVVVLETEAARIESEAGDRVRRATLPGPQRRPVPQDRVTRFLVSAISLGRDAGGFGRAEKIGEGGFTPGAQVEHTAAGGVPRLRAGNVDVYVILI